MELVDMNSLGLFDLKILSVQVGFTLLKQSKKILFFYQVSTGTGTKKCFFIILLYLVYGCY